MIDPHTATAADYIKARLSPAMADELARVALIDNVAAETMRDATAKRIARTRCQDLLEDAARVRCGAEPETFTGKLNAFTWAATQEGLSRVGMYAILERGPL